MRKIIIFLSILLVITVFVSYLLETSHQNKFYEVKEVIDGDTIKILYEGELTSLRLIGVDAPEINHPEIGKECFGNASSQFLRSYLKNKTIYLEFDPTQQKYDKYSRLLAYIFLKNGTNVNKQLIRKGYAKEYTYDNKYKFRQEFLSAQRYAKKNNKGLWKFC